MASGCVEAPALPRRGNCRSTCAGATSDATGSVVSPAFGAELLGTLVLPFGLDLEKGITIAVAVDEGQPGANLRFRTCLPRGCVVSLSFAADVTDALRRGGVLKVGAIADGGAPMRFKGFASALARRASSPCEGKPARVVVRGRAGFIGWHLCQRLLEAGQEVVASTVSTARAGNIAALFDEPSLHIAAAGLGEAFGVEVEAICSLACPASPVHYPYAPVRTIRTSAGSTLRWRGRRGVVSRKWRCAKGWSAPSPGSTRFWWAGSRPAACRAPRCG